LVEELARGSDERPSLLVFTIAGRLADEHHLRARAAFAGHAVLGPLAQVAFRADFDFRRDLGEHFLGCHDDSLLKTTATNLSSYSFAQGEDSTKRAERLLPFRPFLVWISVVTTSRGRRHVAGRLGHARRPARCAAGRWDRGH